MKRILIIGIGAGNPDHITFQAVNALNQASVFFILDKGPEKARLAALRQEICARFIRGTAYRFVEAAYPERDRHTADYRASVTELNHSKAALFERLIDKELPDGSCGAFLVWGDPSLYDSTIRVMNAVIATGRHDIDFEIIPGISSVQALAARHRTTLTRIGQSVEITTGRRIAQGLPDGADSVVVMLDGEDTYRNLKDQDLQIYWGAYVGTPDEILISGKLRDVADEIEQRRTAARKANGWIMDCYLLRRSSDTEA
jgi:precorrin-6A synthase